MTPLSLGIFASANITTAAGDFYSIATVTVGSGGASTVTFSSIPSTYTHLQIRGITKEAHTSAVGYSYMRFNSDSGSNYAAHLISGNDDGSISAGQASSITSTYTGPIGGNVSNTFGIMIIDILDYANTNKYKTARTYAGIDNNTSATEMRISSNLWMSTSAIDSISLHGNEANWSQYTHFALYGIKVAA